MQSHQTNKVEMRRSAQCAIQHGQLFYIYINLTELKLSTMTSLHRIRSFSTPTDLVNRTATEQSHLNFVIKHWPEFVNQSLSIMNIKGLLRKFDQSRYI